MATECLSGSCFPTGGVKPLKQKEIEGVVVCILLSVIVGVLGRKYSKREIFGVKKVGHLVLSQFSMSCKIS